MGISPSTANPSLYIRLQNQTSSSTVYAYITGQAINNNNALFLLQSDGVTPYYPTSPSSTGQPLAVDCGIKLGAPGSSTVVQIPYIAGGRIWFSVNDTLTFLLNPGPGLVEPSVSNPSDPNYNKLWDFCEFTFNSSQVFVNISYVDFVSLPIALSLSNTSGAVQNVSGLPSNGLQTVCSDLVAQNNTDGAGWNQLIVNRSDGSILRALSPNTGIVMNSNLFSGYYDNYVNAVWNKYATTPALTVDTQAQWGVVSGQTVNNLLNFSGIGSFSKPNAKDIFSCSTGPFAASSTNTAEMGNLTARISAAFNRSTILSDSTQPDSAANYYQNGTTNHYARILHAVNTDGRGYAFPYDDVGPSGGADQSGSVSDGSPAVLTVTLGGAS